MARLVLHLDGQVLAEYNMSKERYTIGRLPDNDIRIDNPAVSGHHALVINILNDSFLEDLNSTNGTYVNGKIIKKHALQHGDVITVGHHALRFVDSEVEEPEDEFQKTMVISPRDAATLMAGSPKAAAAMQPPRRGRLCRACERRRVAFVPERRAAARETAGAVGPVRGPRARTREDAHHARPPGRAGGGDHASRRRLLHRARRERQGRRLSRSSTAPPSARRRAGSTTTTSCSSRASRWGSSKADRSSPLPLSWERPSRRSARGAAGAVASADLQRHALADAAEQVPRDRSRVRSHLLHRNLAAPQHHGVADRARPAGPSRRP